MAKHHVALQGCDDSTHFDIWLSRDERNTVERMIAHADQAGAGGCKPRIALDPEDCAKACTHPDES